jgi:hypothetical protein
MAAILQRMVPLPTSKSGTPLHLWFSYATPPVSKAAESDTREWARRFERLPDGCRGSTVWRGPPADDDYGLASEYDGWAGAETEDELPSRQDRSVALDQVVFVCSTPRPVIVLILLVMLP